MTSFSIPLSITIHKCLGFYVILGMTRLCFWNSVLEDCWVELEWTWNGEMSKCSVRLVFFIPGSRSFLPSALHPLTTGTLAYLWWGVSTPKNLDLSRWSREILQLSLLTFSHSAIPYASNCDASLSFREIWWRVRHVSFPLWVHHLIGWKKCP